MKVVPFLLLIVFLHDVISQEEGSRHSSLLNVLPRKTRRMKDMQILISRKFLNSKPLPTKHPSLKANGYTVFPPIGLVENQKPDIPNSPYFPVGHQDDHIKPREKGVISDYAITSIRKKRDISKEQKRVKGKLSDNKSNKEDSIKKAKPLRQRVKGKPIKTNRKKTVNHEMKRSRNSKFNKRREAKLKRNDRLRSNTKRSKKSRAERRNRNMTKVTSKRLKANDSRRLIAARDAMIEEYPYVVSIQKNGEHWCSGALVNPRMVVTTANCMWKSNRVSRLLVRAGSRHAERGGFLVGIQDVMKHPAWSIRKNPDNDVALLYLDRRIKFSHKLHGVDLPNRVMMPPFDDAWVTSFGAERRDGVFDKKAMLLQVYHTRLMDRNKCNNITQRFGVIVTENFICMAQTGRQAPCTRDTGAPAVSDGVLWGLASWGIRKLCGTERYPAMFSYLASQSNMDFIANATRFLMSDERHYPFLDRYPTVKYVDITTTNNPLYEDYI